MNSEIDSLEIQRLVDGQLDAEEQSCLLQWAKDHPDNWRLMAVAFMEQQQLWRLLQEDQSRHERAALPRAVELQFIPQRSMIRNLIAAAAAVLLGVGAYSAGYMAKSEDRAATTKPTEMDMAESMPMPDDDTELKITWAHLTESISEPLVDEPIREILARQGVMTFEQPVIYYIQDDAGGGYVIPKREAVLVSQHQ